MPPFERRLGAEIHRTDKEALSLADPTDLQTCLPETPHFKQGSSTIYPKSFSRNPVCKVGEFRYQLECGVDPNNGVQTLKISIHTVDGRMHHLRIPGMIFSCKYQQPMGSHGFKVVRNGFRPSTVSLESP